MLTDRTTLTQFLIEERRRHPGASGELNALILDVALACKAIAKRVAYGALGDVLGAAGTTNVQGETQAKLDVLANDLFLRATSGAASSPAWCRRRWMRPVAMPDRLPARQVPAACSIRSTARPTSTSTSRSAASSRSCARPTRAPTPPRPTSCSPARSRSARATRSTARRRCSCHRRHRRARFHARAAARRVHPHASGDPHSAERPREFAINASNSRFWEPAVKRYVDECLAGRGGPRGQDFNMRWIASLVAETHRILMRGGVFLYPRDTQGSGEAGAAAAALRGEPDVVHRRAGGRPREQRARAHPRRARRTSCTSASASSSARARRSSASSDYHARRTASASTTRRCSARGLFRAPV